MTRIINLINKIMRKNLFKLSLVCVVALSFTACKDEPNHVPTSTDVVSTSNGLFVVGSGSNYSGIDGDLTYYDYTSKKETLNAFKAANGRTLGTNPNAGITYGSKVYLTVTEENVIEVLDKNTLKEIVKISTTDQLGAKQGLKPRQLFAMNGNVYYTTYGGDNGSVAEIDTTAYKVTRSWTVGSYPEGITGSPADGGVLLVANSNYAMGNGTLSWIDLSRDTNSGVTTKAVEGIKNPTQVFISQGQYYAVDLGQYQTTPPYAQSGTGLKKVSTSGSEYTSETVAPATMAALVNNVFYTIDASYGASTVSYNKYAAGKVTTLSGVSVDSPCAINVDPVSKHIFIASYNLVKGWPSYTTNGYVCEFTEDGTAVSKFQCGVSACCIFFNTSLLWQ